MLATAEIYSDFFIENNSLSILNSIGKNSIAGLPQHVHIVYFKICSIRTNRGFIIYDTQDRYM